MSSGTPMRVWWRLGGDLAAARCLVSMGTAAFDDEYEQVPSSCSTNSVRWNTRLTSSDRTHSHATSSNPAMAGHPEHLGGEPRARGRRWDP